MKIAISTAAWAFLFFLLSVLVSFPPVSSQAAAQIHPPYTIVLENVQEVCLLGRADLEFFTRLLAPEGLHPTVHEGHAVLMLCAVDAVYGGTRYREAPLTVFTSREPGGSERDGAFLLRAYNTSRFFAWVERVRNHAPYYHARIPRSYQQEHSFIQLVRHNKPVLDARMSGKASGSPASNSLFEGPLQFPVALVSKPSPKDASKNAAPMGEQMWARLEGPMMVYPFLPGEDTLQLGEASLDRFAELLQASHFEPRAWWLREKGKHSVTDLPAR